VDIKKELLKFDYYTKQKDYNNIDVALEDEKNQKRFSRLIIEFKHFVVFNRFGFIFQEFFGKVSFEEFLEKGLTLSFNELQILNVLVDTYMYIRDLYFPNYNKVSNADDIVANWEILFKDITYFFKQLLDLEFVREDSGTFVGNHLSYDNFRNLGVEPSNDIVEYINFTARFLREFYQVNDNLKSIDAQSCIVKIDFEDQSVKDFIDELRTTIDFTEKRKINLINERGEAIWFQVKEVTSKGEKNLLDLVTLIKTRSFEGNYIILVDEIEEGLHLEWSRRLINFLINEFNQFSNTKIQFIFTTHSPFMLSDIKNGNVICLVKDEEDVKVKLMRNTFAKNIQEIMHDDMFIKDIYGEFAISKINKIIKELDPLQDSDTLMYYLTKENLLSEIDMISEPLLRNKLYEMYERKFQESTIDNRIEQLKLELENLESKRINQ
ncbi:AAA family ATPase, partial [Streptococcus cristatus]|uniref:AAA family ATPase n=1 Tax=Streptococcus cristatus TaxID=45634 RepID=UPI0011600278